MKNIIEENDNLTNKKKPSLSDLNEVDKMIISINTLEENGFFNKEVIREIDEMIEKLYCIFNEKYGNIKEEGKKTIIKLLFENDENFKEIDSKINEFIKNLEDLLNQDSKVDVNEKAFLYKTTGNLYLYIISVINIIKYDISFGNLKIENQEEIDIFSKEINNIFKPITNSITKNWKLYTKRSIDNLNEYKEKRIKMKKKYNLN